MNADVSTQFYSLHQDWLWHKTSLKDPRRYTFLGMYRKYSEASLEELLRLVLSMKKRSKQSVVSTFDPSCLFITYAGTDTLSIFFKKVKLLERIV